MKLKLKKSLLVILFTFLEVSSVVIASENSQVAVATNELPCWITREKIRAGYLGWQDLDVVPQAAEAGFNLLLVKFGELESPLTAKNIEQLKKWSYVCSSNKIRFMPVINYWGWHERRWIKPKYLYKTSKRLTKAPCYLEKKSFDKLITNRFQSIAKLSKTLNIAGVGLDMEMYGADVSCFGNICLCDYCFEKYLDGRTVSQPLPIGKRYAYLLSTNSKEEYKNFVRREARKLADSVRVRLKGISPEFVIGFLAIDQPNDFYLGLCQGFGEQQRPILAFTERTYFSGYGPYVANIDKILTDNDCHSMLIVGLWQKQIPPNILSSDCYNSARSNGGYWIYNLRMLSDSQPKPNLGTKREYWAALRLANSELDKLIIDETYKSFLKVVTVIRAESIDVASLKTLQGKLDFHNTQQARKSPIRFRQKNTVFFNAVANESLRINLKCIKLANYRNSATAWLISPGGDMLVSTTAEPGKQSLLETVCPSSGIYTIILDSGLNAVELTLPHSYVIAADEKINLITSVSPLYLYAPAGVESGRLLAKSGGRGEAFIMTFKDENDRIIAEHNVLNKESVSLTLSAKEVPQNVKLEFKPFPGAVLEDVSITILDGFVKYVSPWKFKLAD